MLPFISYLFRRLTGKVGFHFFGSPGGAPSAGFRAVASGQCLTLTTPYRNLLRPGVVGPVWPLPPSLQCGVKCM